MSRPAKRLPICFSLGTARSAESKLKARAGRRARSSIRRRIASVVREWRATALLDSCASAQSAPRTSAICNLFCRTRSVRTAEISGPKHGSHNSLLIPKKETSADLAMTLERIPFCRSVIAECSPGDNRGCRYPGIAVYLGEAAPDSRSLYRRNSDAWGRYTRPRSS